MFLGLNFATWQPKKKKKKKIKKKKKKKIKKKKKNINLKQNYLTKKNKNYFFGGFLLICFSKLQAFPYKRKRRRKIPTNKTMRQQGN